MAPKPYGLIIEPLVLGKDWVAGTDLSVLQFRGEQIIAPDGQWLAYLPTTNELQSPFGFESSACASFGTLNAIEILLRRIYGEIENFSDRFLAKMSVTLPTGNSVQKVAETLRKNGTVKETDWPYTPDMNTWEEYYSDIPQNIKTMAIGEFAEYDFRHEYVPTYPNALMSYLKFSPLGVSVSAWNKGADGLYLSTPYNNHWVVMVGYVKDKYWLIFDTYSDDGIYIKKLVWDYNFQIAKKYSIKIQVANPSAFTRFLTQLRLWLGL